MAPPSEKTQTLAQMCRPVRPLFGCSRQPANLDARVVNLTGPGARLAGTSVPIQTRIPVRATKAPTAAGNRKSGPAPIDGRALGPFRDSVPRYPGPHVV